ncbi:MAG: mechanosensitive ion channel domain-containing protein [Prochlorothrix sp.]|nr:mechanosensitive ion channel domain-containing protein [Prochlorothrix sp.]
MTQILDFLNTALGQLVPREALIEGLRQILQFLAYAAIALLLGQFTPRIVRFLIKNFSPEPVSEVYKALIDPVQSLFRTVASLVFLSLALSLWPDYGLIYEFSRPFLGLATTVSTAWLVSRIFRQFFLKYGINVLNPQGKGSEEVAMVLETIVNVMIGVVAAVAFAQSQNFNLVGLLASLGIGGLAIAFAAQKILEQLLSTIVLYLDKPFMAGDYIRLNGQNELGRVESIGLRSTKVRISGKSTLLIIPNSDLINTRIENVTRAKKVMVMLYMDFANPLQDQEGALVSQIIKDSTNSLLGIDPGSTSIALLRNERGGLDRARVTFFILGSGDSSVEFRKQLLALANERISKQLEGFGITVTVEDPVAYVDSPVTV